MRKCGYLLGSSPFFTRPLQPPTPPTSLVVISFLHRLDIVGRFLLSTSPVGLLVVCDPLVATANPGIAEQLPHQNNISRSFSPSLLFPSPFSPSASTTACQQGTQVAYTCIHHSKRVRAAVPDLKRPISPQALVRATAAITTSTGLATHPSAITSGIRSRP